MVRSWKLNSLFTFGGGSVKTRVRDTRLLKLFVSAFVFAFCCRQLVFNRGHNEQKNEEVCQVPARSYTFEGISHPTPTSEC